MRLSKPVLRRITLTYFAREQREQVRITPCKAQPAYGRALRGGLQHANTVRSPLTPGQIKPGDEHVAAQRSKDSTSAAPSIVSRRPA